MISDIPHHDCQWMLAETMEGDPAVINAQSVEDSVVEGAGCHRIMLWIDGVGAWQVCIGSEFVLGAPSIDNPVADIPLLANISRRHATIHHHSDSWSLKAHQETSVSGSTVENQLTLSSGDEIRLGSSVRLGFRIPSVLSTSAVIDFESEHRPTHSVDGVILLSDHCLLGPRRDHHIRCASWSEAVVLFVRDGQVRCRSKADTSVNGQLINESARLLDGDIVSGEDFRFRVEVIP